MPTTLASDRALIKAAIRRAGGVSQLARAMEYHRTHIYDWLSGEIRLSRVLRDWLTLYVRGEIS